MEKRTKGSVFRSMFAKVITLIVITGIVLFAVSFYILNYSMKGLQQELTGSRLHSDINHIRDIIGEGNWNIKDNALYLGNTLIGDGTEANANLKPFLECEKKTGTFSYTFMKCSDEGLEWVGDKETGYQQGHFMRTAGSTLGPNGESIVGTYMDKLVADVLDSNGIYMGFANVAGRKIYCIYETLVDDGGNVVGAIVVGRGIEELNAQLESSTNQYIITYFIIIAAIVIIMIFMLSQWTNSIKKVAGYLHEIGTGDYPEKPLQLSGSDEMQSVADSINEMVISLKEKDVLSQYQKGVQKTAITNMCINLTQNTTVDRDAVSKTRSELGNNFELNGQKAVEYIVNPEDLKHMSQYFDVKKLLVSAKENQEIECVFRADPRKILMSYKLNDEKAFQAKYIDKEWIWVCMHGVYVKGTGDDILLYLDFTDVNERMQNEEDIRKRASQDALTGLLNRNGYRDELTKYIYENPEASGTLFMLDLDSFKEVNDNFGHPEGDRLLLGIANQLRHIFRSNDLLCRLGGDEFCAFAKGFTSKELLERRAESILNMEKKTYTTPDGRNIQVTVSIGMASYPNDANDISELYDLADKALYEAKRAGKNCYRFSGGDQ